MKTLNFLLIFMIIGMQTGLYEITSIKGTAIAFMIILYALCNIFERSKESTKLYNMLNRCMDCSVYVMLGTVIGECFINGVLKVV